MAKQRTGPARYALYNRCSSDDQAQGDFTTIDVQDALNRQYIAEKGGTCAGAYKDEGISGTHLKRKGWHQLLADAQAKKFDIVICTYMSRLGRGDVFTVAEYLLKEAGVKVEMVKEQFTNDMSGHVNKKMTQFVDGMYVEQVRQWTNTKMEAMVAAGFFPGGYPPFGCQKVIAAEAAGFHKAGKEPPKRLIPHPEEGPIVRQAFALFLDTRSQAKVRDYLNAVTARAWTTTAVKSLLTNPVYKGDIVFGQWRNVGAYEPVVEPETWETAQSVITAREHRPARVKADDYTYYLHGRVRCPHCGCPFTQTSAWGRSSRVHYYICQTANRKASRGNASVEAQSCPIRSVNADRLHATVLHFLDHAAKHRTFMHKLIAQSGGWGSADEAQKALRGQLGKQKQSVEMRIANYVKAVGSGRMSDALLDALSKAEAERETVCRMMAQADAEIAAATVKRPTAAQVQEAWGNIGRIWKVLTEEERTELLSSFVQTVEMTEKETVTLELLPIPLSPPSFPLFSQNYSERFGLCTPIGSRRVQYPHKSHL